MNKKVFEAKLLNYCFYVFSGDIKKAVKKKTAQYLRMKSNF